MRARLFDALIQRYRLVDPDHSDLERLLQFRSPSDLEKFQELLSFTPEDFMRMVDACKLGLVLSTSEHNLEQTLAFYQQEFNFTTNELKRLVVKYPATLGYSIERTVIPHVEFFEELGLGPEQYKHVLMRAPSAALNNSIEKTLQPRVEHLQELLDQAEGRAPRKPVRSSVGRPEAQPESMVGSGNWDDWGEEPPGRPEKPQSLAAQVILRFPQVLTVSEDNMDAHVEFLLGLGMSDADVGVVIRKHPQILTYKIERMEDVVLYFLDIGFRDEDIPKVVTRFPQAMSLSLENNLQKKCEFYIDNISHDLSPIVAMPSYLGMSLEKRIKPRYERLQDAGVSLEDSPAYTFLSLLFLSEQKFQARMEQHMDQDMFQTRLEQHLQEQGVTGEL